jgi:hypothetical protein
MASKPSLSEERPVGGDDAALLHELAETLGEARAHGARGDDLVDEALGAGDLGGFVVAKICGA